MVHSVVDDKIRILEGFSHLQSVFFMQLFTRLATFMCVSEKTISNIFDEAMVDMKASNAMMKAKEKRTVNNADIDLILSLTREVARSEIKKAKKKR